MFTNGDFGKVDENYFGVLLETGRHIQVKSKNTGHYWDIEWSELFAGKSAIIINHKHNEADTFHIQPFMHPRTIVEAQRMIGRVRHKLHPVVLLRNRFLPSIVLE